MSCIIFFMGLAYFEICLTRLDHFSRKDVSVLYWNLLQQLVCTANVTELVTHVMVYVARVDLRVS